MSKQCRRYSFTWFSDILPSAVSAVSSIPIDCSADDSAVESNSGGFRNDESPSSSEAECRNVDEGGRCVSKLSEQQISRNLQEKIERALKLYLPIVYFIFQIEKCPTTQRIHGQGYFRCSQPVRLAALKREFGNGVHFEACKGKEGQNIEYCTKLDSRIMPPVEHGERAQPGKRNDLSIARELVKSGASMRDICFNEQISSYQALRGAQLISAYVPLSARVKPKIVWLHGSTGSGKTFYVYNKALAAGEELWTCSTNLNWFDGYDRHKYVLIDDFRASHCSFSLLLRILDRYPMRLPIKGGFTPWCPERIWVTCPYHPKDTYVKAFARDPEDVNQLLRRIDKIKLFGKEVVRNFGDTVPGFVDVSSFGDGRIVAK